MVETFPQLMIVPTPDFNSFDLMLRHGSKDVEVDFVATVKGIMWNVDGTKPEWRMKHHQLKQKREPFIPGLPSGCTKRQVILMGVNHFFGDREFTTRELIGTLGERYRKLALTPYVVGHTLARSKLFSRRRTSSVIFWKHRKL